MEIKQKFIQNVKLMDQVLETLRYYHYARPTEKIYSLGNYAIFVFMTRSVIQRTRVHKKLSVYCPI
jgi:hypothetical protein